MFAKVIDNQVISVMDSIPVNAENVSNFNLLTPAQLLDYGYYPLTVVKPEVNPDTEKLAGSTFKILTSSVKETYTKMPLSDAEKTSLLGDTQREQIQSVNDSAQEQLQAIASPYPLNEVDTWPNQYQEALAYTVNAGAVTPMLSAIAASAGVTVGELAASVLLKAAAYNSASGAIVGKRKALTNAILAATTPSQVKTIVW